MIRPRRDNDRTLCALLFVLALPTLLPLCVAHALDARAPDNLPTAISVSPDQNWEGIDGKWNTIGLQLGGDRQKVHVFVSTASQQTWAIHSMACVANQTDDATNTTAAAVDNGCFDTRGRTFNLSTSTTWVDNGFYQLWTEKNLGLVGNGQYGWDTVTLGWPGEETATLKSTTIGTLISPNFWLGHFGLNPKPTNFSEQADPSPSYMTYLFEQNLIPSVSFGYTAGAQYRDTIVLSSLTLGGYDASRFIANDLTFGFAPDNERDLVVGIVDITAKSSTKSDINLLTRDSFTMYIDSTVAELWLPTEVCDAFAQAFGLKYDNDTELYLVDDLLHQTLQAENPAVTFSLGQKFLTNATIDITLPYGAFDLEANSPYRGLQSATKYFPIRRGDKEEMYVLGRTFLQEAYLAVDWERQNFSVSAVNWQYGQPKDIRSYTSPNYITESAPQGHRFTTGSIIGVALGVGLGVVIIACAVVWWYWRRREKRKREQVMKAYASQAAVAAKDPSAVKSDEPPTSPIQNPEDGSNVFRKAELPAISKHQEGDATSPTLFGMPSPPVEVENNERQVFEMPGDYPTSAEAGGRQLSEKETMMVRERIINGTDPNGIPDVAQRPEEMARRPPPINPSEVTMVNRRLPNVSPFTPRTPRDGSSLEANDTFFQPPLPRPPRSPRDGRFLEAEDTLLGPISPLEGPEDTSRRRFSYEV